MEKELLRILGAPVQLTPLRSGDVAIWHPVNEAVRAVVEPICRGRGYWDTDHRNWVVFARFKTQVCFELRARSGGRHG